MTSATMMHTVYVRKPGSTVCTVDLPGMSHQMADEAALVAFTPVC